MKIFKPFSCKEVYKYKYGEQDFHFSGARSKLMIAVHMLICKNCQHFERALKEVEEKMKATIKNGQQKLNPEKVEQLKQSIKKKL